MIGFLKNMLIGLFLAIVFALMFSGIRYLFDNKTNEPEIRIVEIDGHEYIIMTFSSFPEGRCVAHKADCKKEQNHE